MLISRVFILLYCSFFFFPVFGQNFAQKDSTKSKKDSIPILEIAEKDFKIYSFQEQDFNFLITHFQPLDTNLHGFQIFEPVYGNNFELAHLGVLGSPSRNFLNPIPAFQNFNWGWNQYQLYQWEAGEIDYYKTNVPVVIANFRRSPKATDGALSFDLLHSQKISKNWTAGLAYRQFRADGFFQNQQANSRNFSFFTQFQSPKKNYQFFGNYTSNRNENQENGGLENDSIFQIKRTLLPENEPVRLSNANSELRNRQFYFSQYFKPKKDSTTTKYIVLFHNFLFKTNYFRFEDPNSLNDFYPSIFNDSTSTFDSTAFRTIQNVFGIKNNRREKFYWSLDFKHQFLKSETFADLRNDSNFINKDGKVEKELESGLIRYNFPFENHLLASNLKLNYKVSARLNFFFKLNANLLGQNGGNYYLKLGGEYYSKKFQFLKLYVSQQNRSPNQIENRYRSTHYFWDANLRNENITEIVVETSYKKLYFRLKYNQIKNHIYFLENGEPNQFSENINLFNAQFYFNLNYKKLNWRSRIIFQNSSHENILSVPNFWLSNSLYLHHRFKKGFIMELGADLRYNSTYFAKAYQPATGQFYTQNHLKTGNYWFVAPFFNVRVKTVRLFFKYENLNNLFLDYGSFSSLGFANPDGVFRFGVSWVFFN